MVLFFNKNLSNYSEIDRWIHYDIFYAPNCSIIGGLRMFEGQGQKKGMAPAVCGGVVTVKGTLR